MPYSTSTDKRNVGQEKRTKMLGAYSQFCAYLERVSGIVLGEEKKYLVESRIVPLVKREKLDNLSQLLMVLQSGKNVRLQDEVINAMTINETYFFRDKFPFDVVADKLLPQMNTDRPGTDPLRIWSAACSTGQEPYSLSIIVEEKQQILRGRKVEIVGTDVCEPVIARAREGFYSTFEVERGLSKERLSRHFVPGQGGWKIKPNIQQRVTFRPMNLLADYSSLGMFDLIMCRNVLIYFNTVQKGEVINRLGKCLRSNGYLMLGASESPFGASSQLVSAPDLKGCYRWTAATASSPMRTAVSKAAS